MAKKPPVQDTGIDVINAPQDLFGDLYHTLLRAPWWVTLVGIAAMVLVINIFFALVYLYTGGIANARAGSFADAFFFSVQTIGTIGYGAMYPQSTAANVAMTVESIAALVVAAVATGLVFAKFSMPQARLVFAHNAVIFRYNGVPTLALRLSNTRGNYIVEATVRVTLSRAEVSKEGVPFYRMYDLRLVRDRSPALGKSWTVLHQIVDGSPLQGATSESMLKEELEIIVSVTGIDGTSSQNLHGRHLYDSTDIRFGYRYADMLSPPHPDGRVTLDYSKLHEITQAEL